MFVTKNVEWTQEDRAAADSNNVRIITEKEMFYYKEISKRVGYAARYQFHAEFLSKTKVSALQSVEVSAIRTKIGPYRVYSFFAPAKKILPICFVNHRDLRDPAAAPSYQRLIQKSRLKSISDFITKGGIFPNSIILNFEQKITFSLSRPEDKDGVSIGSMTLPSTYKSAWIIDGQHRIYGYADISDENSDDLLPFFAFENISISDETKLFSEINSKQKRVEKKLLDEITGEIKLQSSDKREQMRAVASRVFDMMRDDDDGPLGGKITGAEISHSDSSILTIPFLVDAVLHAGLLGRISQKDGKSIYSKGPLEWDNPTQGIDALVEFLTEYLKLFQNANSDRWDAGRQGKISTNPGVSAILRLSADILVYLGQVDNIDVRATHPKKLVERMETYIAPCTIYLKNASDSDVEQRFQIPFGSGGPRIFQHRLREQIHSTFSDFDAPGFKDDLRKYDAERTDRTDKMIRSIQEHVHGFILKKLKSSQNGVDDYLEKAIANREVLKKAFEKRLDSDDTERKDMGTYLDFLDLKKIVESPKVWPLFSASLSIQMPDEKKGKAKYIFWFDVINKARRIPAHPYNRGYSDEDVRDVEYIYNQLRDRGVVGAETE
jgi:DGQHR domain-containing protein